MLLWKIKQKNQNAVFEDGMNSKVGIKVEAMKKSNVKMTIILWKKGHNGIKNAVRRK